MVLDDAEEKEIANSYVKAWLDELMDAVYDADDLLAEAVCESRATAGNSGSVVDWAKRFLATFDPWWKESKFEKELEEILDRLDGLKKYAEVLGLVEATALGFTCPLPLEIRTTSLVDKTEVHGRGADVKAVTRLLMSEETNGTDGLEVIAIVGMGGVGKTTLAQLVYEQKEVLEKFQLKAWVCVSEETDVSLVTRNILKGFVPRADIGFVTSNDLHNRLESTLTGKRFLLVLDDVWDEFSAESWKILLKHLKHGLYGSRIIVTTRSTKVASLASTNYFLKELGDDESWLVFARCAFKDEDPTAYPDLATIGRKIVAKCGGLPLVVNALGCLLKTRRDSSTWERIMNSEIWKLEDARILPALRLSYHYIPSSLKRCFAYCALFPKAYEFEIDELVRLWMAEGILDSHQEKRPMEEIGHEYFCDLFSRSFFQRSSASSSRFVMHDLVHDLAKSAAGNFYHRLKNDNACLLPEKTRHLSYISATYNTSQKCAGIYQSNSLRSFLPIRPFRWYRHEYMDRDVVKHLLEASKRLRLLSLSNYVNIKEIPESIGNMKLLRYLDLSRTRIIRLPEVVCKLCNLETLWLEECRNLGEVPDSIVDLKCLHFLNLAGTPIKKLPTNLSNLVNLCALDISWTKLQEMPPKLGKLTRLQKLADFFVGKGSSCSSIEELKELSKLKGKLRIWNLQNVVNVEVASGSILKGKNNLRDLELTWEGDEARGSQQELKVLEGLEPPCTLEHLTVRGYRSTKFPDWVGHRLFSNLVSLRIEGCKNYYQMPPLGHVDSLKTLHISGCDGIVVVGPSFYGSPLHANDKPPFKSLEVLHFEGMPEWKAWEQHDGAFPGLQELNLLKCPKLANALPSELPSLKKLCINGCHQLVAPLPRAPLTRNESCSPLEWVLEHFKCLDSLSISHCLNVVCFPNCEVVSPSLTELGLYDLKNLKSLPKQMKLVLPCLVDLRLSSCPELESFPEGGLPFTLESLRIDNCKKLMAGRKQWNLQALPSLSSLTVKGGDGYSFDETESFPEAMLLPCTLTSLFMGDLRGLKSLDYKGLGHLTSLQKLRIQNCSSLKKLPEQGLPQSLTTLEIWDLPNLNSLRPIQRLTSLTSLFIGICDNVSEVALPSTITCLRVHFMKMKSLHGWGLHHLTCLRELHIHLCDNIESITEEEALPSSLRVVELRDCTRLKSIQREGFPSSLECLHINLCPLLEEKYRGEGEEWQFLHP